MLLRLNHLTDSRNLTAVCKGVFGTHFGTFVEYDELNNLQDGDVVTLNFYEYCRTAGPIFTIFNGLKASVM